MNLNDCFLMHTRSIAKIHHKNQRNEIAVKSAVIGVGISMNLTTAKMKNIPKLNLPVLFRILIFRIYG
jgi:hypothetical protein